MRFTVLICTHNRARLLAQTLAAVAAQRYAAPWEILVVDNGSTDDTSQVVADAAAQHRVPIRYAREDRSGKSAALNTGIAQAAGDFIAFTDDDACPHPDWLEQLERGFTEFHADWLFGPVRPVWPDNPPNWFCDDLNGNFALLDYGPRPLTVESRAQVFFGVNCAVHRHALARSGPFREDLGVFGVGGVGGGEDIEMFERALSQGLKIVYTPHAVVGHVIGPERLTKRFHRNKTWISRRTYYRLVQRDSGQVPSIFGVPRYHFVLALKDLFLYAANICRMQPGKAFFHELRLIRFGGLLSEVLAHNGYHHGKGQSEGH
jgi:glycosyltransferase involved in cell wall biosynthesis